MKINMQDLLAATNDLILDPEPRFKLEALEALTALARRYPITLGAELAVLNPLLQLIISDTERAAGVKGMIDAKRAALGYAPCWPEPEAAKFEKNPYQSKLMRERRAYAGRATEIENMQRPAASRLMGPPRLEFETRQLAKWGAKCKAIEDTARLAAGGSLTQHVLQAIKSQFWGRIDASLEETEKAVRAELLKPQHQRNRVMPHE